MGVPTSEVSYTSATARRGDNESSYEHVVALEKKSFVLIASSFYFRNIVHMHLESLERGCTDVSG